MGSFTFGYLLACSLAYEVPIKYLAGTQQRTSPAQQLSENASANLIGFGYCNILYYTLLCPITPETSLKRPGVGVQAAQKLPEILLVCKPIWLGWLEKLFGIGLVGLGLASESSPENS